MKLFESNKNAGLALIIVGTMSLFIPLFFLIAIISDPAIWSEVKGILIICIFSTLMGFIEVWDGALIYRSHEAKIEIICEYITITTIIILIDVFSDALSLTIDGEEIGDDLLSIILSLIATVLSLFMVRSMKRNVGSSLDVLMWYTIVIFFTVSLLLTISEMIDSAMEIDVFEIVDDICMFIVYGFVIAGMFTSEIREKMGVCRKLTKPRL
jgi:hypothetical protein